VLYPESMKYAVVLVGLSLLACAHQARAQDTAVTAGQTAPVAERAPTPPSPLAVPALPVRTETVWYGWQTLVSDAATGVSTMLLTQIPNNAGVILPNLGIGFVLGAPLVHLFNGRPGVAVGDLLLRGAVGVGSVALSLSAFGSCMGGSDPATPTNCQAGTDLTVAALLIAGAIVVDAAAFSWERKTPGAPAPTSGFTLTPTFVVGKERSVVGLGGTF
jgi:hypothetical protein